MEEAIQNTLVLLNRKVIWVRARDILGIYQQISDCGLANLDVLNGAHFYTG